MTKKKASAYIFIFNQKNELLLQLRSSQDDSYPLHYDCSAAGGIHEGEDPELAAKRELKEELGVEADLTFLREDEYEGAKMYIYVTRVSGGFNIGKEVESVKFASFKEINEMIENKEKFHPEFPYLFRRLFE